ncbi:MAG: hypothetical protein LUG50_08890 [Planctomycetaceae bacterium]|nr:hypothetical protein [Planctomycetaceae bacterium]
MLSIHNNFNLSTLSRGMRTTGRDQSNVMEKLSSGFRINKASDDPAGLIQSERLQSQIAGIERAIQNSIETDNILGVVEGAFSEVTTVLRDLKTLAIASANTGVTSLEMIAANQAEMDSGIQAIDRILNSTSYGGKKVLENLDLKDMLPGQALSDDQVLDLGLPPGTYFVDEKRLTAGGDFVGAADGMLVNGDKTFLIPAMGKNDGKTLEVTFKDGTSLDDVVAELRRIMSGENGGGEATTAEPSPVAADDGATASTAPENTSSTEDTKPDGNFRTAAKAGDVVTTDPADLLASLETYRLGEDPNEVWLSNHFIDSLDTLSDEEAKNAIATRINAFVPVVSLEDSDMSKEDKALYQAVLDLKNMGIHSLGSTQGEPYVDANGQTVRDTYTLKDVLSGNKACLYNDPVLALRIIEKSAKEVLANRSTIGAIRTAFSHERGALSSAHENLTRMDSTLRDTDMALSTIEFTRTKVLEQFAMGLFAGVREQYQNTLDLLV